ncbi:MAG: carboxypeptidase regulatory-like domain-containing protein [Fodinibius sp.]|nr:carboxypeptidase regulatory-like domain-containing protein [Fodinibius sp.]
MKKVSSVLLVSIAAIVLFFTSCGSPTSEDGSGSAVSISGMVVDGSQAPIPDAIVRIISPPPEKVTTTDSTGSYNFEVNVDSSTSYVIEARKEGLPTKSEEFLAVPDRNIELPDFVLGSSDTTDGDDGQDDEQQESEGSAYISLDNLSNKEIRVSGAGGNETSDLTFTVTDSAGTPISDNNAEYVNFALLEAPSGVSIYPDSARTSNGQVTATIKSGTESGVVQVQASFSRNTNPKNKLSNVKGGQPSAGNKSSRNAGFTGSFSSQSTSVQQKTVTHESKPVQITVTGGMPSSDHFKMQSASKNMVASSNESNQISVDLGDQYGNNVPEGTAVYFKTDLGTIGGSASTDGNGVATSNLQTGDPGTATITAETVDRNDQKISKQTNVVFSGSPELSVSPASADLQGLTEQSFSYTLQDENGNPLASGTSISVSVNNENLTVTGDTEVTLDDFNKSGAGKTEFNFTLQNPDGTVDNRECVHYLVGRRSQRHGY